MSISYLLGMCIPPNTLAHPMQGTSSQNMSLFSSSGGSGVAVGLREKKPVRVFWTQELGRMFISLLVVASAGWQTYGDGELSTI